MKRIIDISIKHNQLWAEDENYISDFANEDGYLFSIEVGSSVNIFHKDYPHAKNTFKGKYYITLTYGYDGELFCTNDYNSHIDHNIVENYYMGDCIRDDYQDTIILDMDKNIASRKDETNHISAIIKDSRQEAKWQREHENNFRQPY